MKSPSDRRTFHLENPDPSLRLLALRELAELPEHDPEVQRTKAEIPATAAVQALFKDMRPEAYWIQKDARTGKEYGAGVEYGAYASTHYRLGYLAELGMDKSDPRIASAADRYLGLQKDNGDFLGKMSCLLGLNIRTFAKLGYRDDPRMIAALELLMRTDRPDSGYLCDMHEKPDRGVSGRPLKRPKSCFRGSAKVLSALALFPEYAERPRTLALAEYFLAREGIFKRSVPEEYVTRDAAEPSFPFTWSADVIQVLYALATLGYGNDPRLKRAWHVLENLRDDDGFVRLAWMPAKSPWKPEKKGERSAWISLYADIAEKRKNDSALRSIEKLSPQSVKIGQDSGRPAVRI